MSGGGARPGARRAPSRTASVAAATRIASRGRDREPRRRRGPATPGARAAAAARRRTATAAPDRPGRAPARRAPRGRRRGRERRAGAASARHSSDSLRADSGERESLDGIHGQVQGRRPAGPAGDQGRRRLGRIMGGMGGAATPRRRRTRSPSTASSIRRCSGMRETGNKDPLSGGVEYELEVEVRPTGGEPYTRPSRSRSSPSPSTATSRRSAARSSSTSTPTTRSRCCSGADRARAGSRGRCPASGRSQGSPGAARSARATLRPADAELAPGSRSRPARLPLGAARQHRARRGLRRGPGTRRPGRAAAGSPAAACRRSTACARRVQPLLRTGQNARRPRPAQHPRRRRRATSPPTTTSASALFEAFLDPRLVYSCARLPDERDEPRGRPAGEARARLRGARPRARRPPARDRHRLGRARDPRRRDPRLPGDDDDDLAPAARLRGRAGARRGARRPGRGPAHRLPRPHAAPTTSSPRSR